MPTKNYNKWAREHPRAAAVDDFAAGVMLFGSLGVFVLAAICAWVYLIFLFLGLT